MKHDICPQGAHELVEGINQTMHEVTKKGRSEMPAQWKNSASSRSLLGKGPLELSLEWDFVREAFQTNARAKSPSPWSLGITGCQFPLPYSRQSFAPVGRLHLSENKLFCLSWEQKFIKGKETESGSCWYLRPEGARENKEKVEEGEAAWDRPTEPHSWEREVMHVRIQWGPRAVWPQVPIPQL